MDVDLPPDLRRALDGLMQGRSQRELARRSEALSQLYRSGGTSDAAVRDNDDALAYALTRMPATYAAATAVLAAVMQAWPDLAPRTLLDVGAGPGTAAWAAARCFPGIARIRLVDQNAPLRALALHAMATSASEALRTAEYRLGTLAGQGERADLVVASYVIGELANDALTGAADTLWSCTEQLLVVLEPGTPAGFARIRTLRAHLIAQGALAVAPCPHDHPCPIVDPDWCHFSQRLPRSREHRRVKGASLAFEDEKFSYVVLSRARQPTIGARVLAHPRASKAGISAKLCTAAGIATATANRRDRDRYAALKRWRWGDAVDLPETDRIVGGDEIHQSVE